MLFSDSDPGSGDEVRNLSVTLEKEGRKDSLRSPKEAEVERGTERELAEETENLRKLLEVERKKSEDYLRRLQYLQAELDNYRKRIDKEVREIEEFSTSKLMKKLLPVLDELELAIGSTEASGERNPILEGVRMISKNLRSTLEGEGLRRIDALGKPFNPDLHEALERVQGKNNKEDIVIEEIRAGYIFKDRVLRPTLVKVQVSGKTESPKRGGGESA